MDTRRLVMGDWGRVVRDPLDLLRIALVLGAIASLVAVDLPRLGLRAPVAW